MNINPTPNLSKYSATGYNQSQSTSSKHIASRRDAIYNPISVSNTTTEKNPQLFKKNNNETLYHNSFKMHHISQLANQKKEVQCFAIRHCDLLNKSGFNASETIYLAKMNKRTQEIALGYCKKSNNKKVNPWNIICLSSAKAREESKKSK